MVKRLDCLQDETKVILASSLFWWRSYDGYDVNTTAGVAPPLDGQKVNRDVGCTAWHSCFAEQHLEMIPKSVELSSRSSRTYEKFVAHQLSYNVRAREREKIS